jgi:hypothetical protein
MEAEGSNKTEKVKKVNVWPHLVFRELVVTLFIIFVFIVISLFIDAPLEGIADPTITPSPAKAPWYFVGIQELLVYFDPWLAGVVLPGLIIFGLMAIPYLDRSQEDSGVYAFFKRRFPISMFSLGLAIWFALIAIGALFRGSGWDWYWPWEDKSLHKMALKSTKNLSPVIGAASVFVYFGLGLLIPAMVRKDYYRKHGPVRYTIQTVLILMMFGVLGKILLRLLFNIKYVLTTPWFNI